MCMKNVPSSNVLRSWFFSLVEIISCFSAMRLKSIKRIFFRNVDLANVIRRCSSSNFVLSPKIQGAVYVQAEQAMLLNFREWL